MASSPHRTEARRHVAAYRTTTRSRIASGRSHLDARIGCLQDHSAGQRAAASAIAQGRCNRLRQRSSSKADRPLTWGRRVRRREPYRPAVPKRPANERATTKVAWATGRIGANVRLRGRLPDAVSDHCTSSAGVSG
jgi:hypothetical protein